MSWGENRSEHELAVIKTFSWSTSTQDKSPFRVWRQPVLIPLAEDSLYVGGIKNQHSRNNHKLVYEPQEQRHRVSRNLALPLFFTFLFQFISFCTVFFLFASTLLNFYGCWLSCMKMASRDKHIKYPPRAPIGMGLQANLEFRQRPPSPGPLAYLFENKFWITNRHRHDVTLARMCSKDNARASGTEFSHEFCIWMWVTSSSFSVFLCVFVCVCVCETADFCFGASFRRSIRPDKAHKGPVVPLRRLHAKDFKWKPETQPTRATQNGRLGHKVAKQWKKANTKNGCKKKKKNYERKER